MEFGYADKEAIFSGNFMFTSLETEKLRPKGHRWESIESYWKFSIIKVYFCLKILYIGIKLTVVKPLSKGIIVISLFHLSSHQVIEQIDGVDGFICWCGMLTL